nr:hypothetical protein [Candidatus Anoxychlamydiales bacterium]
MFDKIKNGIERNLLELQVTGLDEELARLLNGAIENPLVVSLRMLSFS